MQFAKSVPGIGTIGNTVVLIDPKGFSAFSEKVISSWMYSFKCNRDEVCYTVASLVEVLSNRMIQFLLGYVPAMVLNSVTKSTLGFSDIAEVWALATR